MDINFEGRLWQKASQVFGVRLQSVVEAGIDSFKRRPGLDDPTTVYAAVIRVPGFDALQGALEAHGLEESAWSGQLSCRAIASQKAFEAPSPVAADADGRLE